tara:strand:+ start:415 stop:999 length:585 start_codon:yes stop_codon:yes gene_type:complete
MSSITRVMPTTLQKTIVKAARTMKKKINSKKRFNNKVKKLEKFFTKQAKKQRIKKLKKSKFLANLKRTKERTANLLAKKKAQPLKKIYKPRRSKEIIAQEKLEKENRIKERVIKNQKIKEAKEYNAQQREQKKLDKLTNARSTKKYAPRRTKAEIQLDIMKNELIRRNKFDKMFNEKFNLSPTSIRSIKRSIRL